MPAVVLLHGWPDSILRFERVLPLLADLEVIVPCLPGYPWGTPVTAAGMSTTAMGDVVVAMLDALGVERCVLSGGDIGSGVATAIAARHPQRVAALHLTDVPSGPLMAIPEQQLTAGERDYRDRARAWQRAEGGYMHEHALSRTRWPRAWPIRRRDWPPGSWRSCGAGVTAPATSSRCSGARSCSPGSPPTG